jgi:hypothetical protein
MTTLMPLDVLKVVGRKVKNHLQWVRAMNHLLVEKIILLVGIYLLVNSKMKKIVQIIQLHQDVNLRTMNKNHLQWVRAMNLLLVMKNHLLVEKIILLVMKNHLQVKHLQLIMVEIKLHPLSHPQVIPSRLLVMKNHLLVIPSRLLVMKNHLQVKHLQLIMVEIKLHPLSHLQVGHRLLDRHQVGHRLLDRHQVGHRLQDHRLYS